MKIIIIGGGEIGFYLAERLTRENKDVVLIDNDFERVQRARQVFDVQVIHGEGSSPKVLHRAGIDGAEMVVAVTTSDEVNMIACLIAKTQSNVPVKVARIRNLEYIHDTNILDKDGLGIDCHINPEMEAADQIINLCQVPEARSVISLADGRFRIFSVKIDSKSGLLGHKLKDLPEFSPQNKVLICVIRRNDKTVIPTGETVIQAEDLLWVISTQDSVHEVFDNIGINSSPIRSAMIFGSTITSKFLAQKLLEQKIGVKIVGTDRERCEQFARELENVLVLHVPNIDASALIEENIDEYSVFIASSSDDEDNILASLLAKRLGVKKAITLLDRPTYQSIIHAIGVDNVVNRRIAAADKILQYLRKGKVQSISSVGDTGTEAIEFEAMHTSDAIGKPLHKIRFPKGSLVVGILRDGKPMIPRGNDIIAPGDRVIIVTLQHVIPKVEKIFQVKVDYF